MSVEEKRAIVRRYYERLWNAWRMDLADALLSPDIAFRGSLGVTVKGLAEFKRYVEMVRAAFPDFHNTIEELVVEEDKVVARLSYRGTHLGELFGVPPTGREITYAGVAIFRIEADKIASGWVLGDILSLMQQLGAVPGTAPR